MDDYQILQQISDEYQLGYNYVEKLRERYKQRLLKWTPQDNNKDKININLIANTIDVLIANFWSSWVKVKFISRQWWIWQEEADNLNAVAEFDKKEWVQQQVEYQSEQDSLFFWVGIVNRTGFDKVKKHNTWRAINPLSWIPDPLPSQTGQFDGQNYRFHWFMMLSNVRDMIQRYGKENMDKFFAAQYNSAEQSIRDTYSKKNGVWPITSDNLDKNFSIDIYTHYCIVDWFKWKFVLDWKLSHIFHREKLEPVLKEEKLNPLLVPRPIILNYYDPQRNSAFGNSLSDKLEDKQNWISILANLNLIKAKKEALGGDFLVNSRLIKNKEELKKKSVGTRYLFVDEAAIQEQPLTNAMYELPQSAIRQDTFTMMNFLTSEANRDSKIDSLQQGLVPDKSMTKAEAQQIQSNANNIISLKNAIKNRYYQEFYYQRWRGYLENFTDWEKKFALLSSDFEWRGTSLKKDEFITKQMPYVMVWSAEDMMALNENQKNYLNQLYPIISNDQNLHETSKNIFKRLVYRVNGLKNNTINAICPYSTSEKRAKDFVQMINLGHKPKSLFSDPNADFFTYWIYLQKADDWDIKDEVLEVLGRAISEMWLEQQANMMMENPMANSAANIMMAQNQPQQDIVSRPDANNPLSFNQ